MKGIESLIKLHKFELDEKRRALKELETVQANIVGAIEALEAEIIREQKSSSLIEVDYAYGAFAGASIPLILDKMGIDPALAGGVLLTTVTDCIGFMAFLGLATIFLI